MGVFLLALALYILFIAIFVKPNNVLTAFLVTLPILLSAVTLCALGLKELGMLTF